MVHDYLAGFAAVMVANGLPMHLFDQFCAEVRARPGEYPLVTRDMIEVYPGSDATTRCYEPGILHWEWADGTGFPQSKRERLALTGRL